MDACCPTASPSSDAKKETEKKVGDKDTKENISDKGKAESKSNDTDAGGWPSVPWRTWWEQEHGLPWLYRKQKKDKTKTD